MSAHLKQWLLTGSTVAGKLRTKAFEKLAKGESLSTTEQAMVNGSFKGGAKIGEQRSIAFAKFDQGLLLTLKEQMLVVASYKGGMQVKEAHDRFKQGLPLSVYQQERVTMSYNSGQNVTEMRRIARAKFDNQQELSQKEKNLLSYGQTISSAFAKFVGTNKPLNDKEQKAVNASYKGGAVIGAKKEAGAIRGKQISEALQDSKMK